MKKYQCNFCNKEFEFEHSISFATHVSHCDQNPNNCSKQLKEIAKSKNPISEYKFNCKKCNKEYSLQLKLTDYNRGNYTKFCSISCRNSRARTTEQKQKISDGVKNSKRFIEAIKERKCIGYPGYTGPKGKRKHKWTTTNCLYYGKPIEHRISIIKKYHNECWRKCSGGYRKNSTIRHNSVYKGYNMQSGSETIFAKFLDKHNIKWIKNEGDYPYNYIGFDNKYHDYFPDFYIFPSKKTRKSLACMMNLMFCLNIFKFSISKF